MVRASHLIAHQPRVRERWGSGLENLDVVTGGFGTGQLWVLTGPPAAGRSLLLLQFAFRLAVEHSLTTVVACTNSGDVDLTRSRLLSLALTRPAEHPDLAVSTDLLTELQSVRLQALLEADLDILIGPGFEIPETARDSGRRFCFALDDPEFRREPVVGEFVRQKLRALADSGAAVLVTVPRHHCLELVANEERLRPEWSSVSDVTLEIVQGLPGLAQLRLHQNRHGRKGDVPVGYFPHLAKFADSAV